MQCSACGAEVPAESIFCAKCGHSLKGDDGGKAPEFTPGGTASAGDQGTSGKASLAERMRNTPGATDDSEDEEVSLWAGGYSGKAMIGGWMIAALITILLGTATVFFLAAWFVLVPLMFVPWIYVATVLVYRKMSVKYELTTQRFVHKSGILKRVSDRLEVIDIDDVTYTQGLLERMVNVGSIMISSSDRTHPELVLKGIENVREIADTIDDVRRKERRRRGLHIEAI